MKLLSYSLGIIEALSSGPKFAYEFDGPIFRVATRIHDINVYYKRLGSHWRIRGRRVHVPDSSGRRVPEMLYRLVME